MKARPKLLYQPDRMKVGFTKADGTQMSGFIQPVAKQQAGFTIVELMIATLIFSVILLICTFGLLQVTRTYFKGVTSTNTQQTARSIMDQISQAIQFSGGSIGNTPATINPGTAYAICINNNRYTFVIDRQLVDGTPNPLQQARHVLVVDPEPCSGPVFVHPEFANQSLGTEGGRELLSPRMRLASFGVTGLGNNLYSVSISVVSGENDVLIDTPSDPSYHKRCGNFRAGSQFCAVSTLSTIVQRRVNAIGSGLGIIPTAPSIPPPPPPPPSAIAAFHLITSRDPINSSSYTTALITPAANRLVLIGVHSVNDGSGSCIFPSVSGGGFGSNWVAVIEVRDSGDDDRCLAIYRAMSAAPGSGTISISFSGQIQKSADWTVSQFANVNTTGTNGSGAIVQSDKIECPGTLSGTICTLNTLEPLGNVNNAVFAAFSLDENTSTYNAANGFTTLGSINGSSTSTTFGSEWLIGSNTPGVSFGITGNIFGVAVEIRAAP